MTQYVKVFAQWPEFGPGGKHTHTHKTTINKQIWFLELGEFITVKFDFQSFAFKKKNTHPAPLTIFWGRGGSVKEEDHNWEVLALFWGEKPGCIDYKHKPKQIVTILPSRKKWYLAESGSTSH